MGVMKLASSWEKENLALCMQRKMDLRFLFTYPSFYFLNFAYLFRIHNGSDISSMHMIIVISLLCWLGGYEICWEDATHAIGLQYITVHSCEYYYIFLFLTHCFRFIKSYIQVNHRLQIKSFYRSQICSKCNVFYFFVLGHGASHGKPPVTFSYFLKFKKITHYRD